MSRAESVHPRLRGELKKLRLRAAATNGSSPLTRGTRRDEYPVLGHLRFIPAYAGNSLLGFYRRSGRTVHPRLRGELFCRKRGRKACFGSSPLTRGTHVFEIVKQKRIRFIPAYAGNSMVNSNVAQVPTVHPRLRGELFGSESVKEESPGSSPLTRGTR